MKEKLRELAKLRQIEEIAKLAKQDAIAEFEASPYYQTLQLNHAEALSKLNECTEEVKKDALRLYYIEQNKKPAHEGYEIKVGTVVEILNLENAREWCFSNFRPALKLDAKTFEKAAKDGNIPGDLAKVSEEPKVYLKSDLSGFIE